MNIELGPPGLEQHLETVMKPHRELLQSYKNHLLKIHIVVGEDKIPHIVRKDGDCYIRFQILGDYSGHNRTFYICELGDIIPNIRWRNLLRSSLGFAPVLLRKRAVFLPAFSFSYDKFFTFVYWGGKQFFLDPQELQKLRLRNLLITIDKPSSAQISAANFAWPHALENVHPEQNSSANDVANKYIFNSLFPPNLDAVNDFWYESPIIILGDRRAEIFTIHKTICAVDKLSIRWLHNNLCLAKCYVLDNKLQVRKTTCGLSRESVEMLVKQPVMEAILIKTLAFTDSEEVKPILHINLYPFESTSIFSKETPGVLLTLLSILLRRRYLDSKELFEFDITTEGLRKDIANIFSSSPFDQYKWNELGTRLLNDDAGIRFLVNILGIYKVIDDRIRFIHPSLFECLLNLIGGVNRLEGTKIALGLDRLSELIKKFMPNQKVELIEKFDIIEDIAGIVKYCPLREIDRLIGSLLVAKCSTIPLSKAFMKC